ncbi:MAG: 30S ribosomal protein S1, partial [bacterium]
TEKTLTKSNSDINIIYGTQDDLDDILKAENEAHTSYSIFDEDEELCKLYDTSIAGVEEGKIVKGKILRITDSDVFVDINFKSEGIIPISEFKNKNDLNIGDEIEIYLEQVEDKDGQIILSKQRADFIKVWENINLAHSSGNLIDGKLVKKIKGGVVVDLFGIDAFLPGSQIDLRQIPDIDNLIGTTMPMKIIKVNKNRRNIVVSRRVVLEEERSVQRSQIIDTLEKGQTRKGIVKNITDFGAFIDLGGVDGLLHITDMSWGRVNHPSEIVALGNDVEVKILDFDEEKTRISLGMKQLTDPPWKDIDKKYPENSRIKGKIVNITDYGAFMELEEGIEGLIHISEMSWTRHVKHPSKIVEIGEMVEAIVLKVDRENQKISLGLKQIEPDPWEKLEDEFPVGSRIKGKIRNLAAFGAFVEIQEGIDGLIHISDMSWTKKVNHPGEFVKKGMTVEAIMLSIDKEKRRISLGLKQLIPDPWPELEKIYAVGETVNGIIVRLLDRGVIVELPENVEGFVANSHLGKPGLKKPSDSFKVGHELPLAVTEFDRENKKITLSVNSYFDTREEQEFKDWQLKQSDASTTIGDVISAKSDSSQFIDTEQADSQLPESSESDKTKPALNENEIPKADETNQPCAESIEPESAVGDDTKA